MLKWTFQSNKRVHTKNPDSRVFLVTKNLWLLFYKFKSVKNNLLQTMCSCYRIDSYHVSSSSRIWNIMMLKNSTPNQFIYKIWFWLNLNIWLSLYLLVKLFLNSHLAPNSLNTYFCWNKYDIQC